MTVVPLMLHLVLLGEEISGSIIHWVHHGSQLVLGVVNGVASSPAQLVHIGLELVVSLILLRCAAHHDKAIEIIFIEGIPVVMVVPGVRALGVWRDL